MAVKRQKRVKIPPQRERKRQKEANMAVKKAVMCENTAAVGVKKTERG